MVTSSPEVTQGHKVKKIFKIWPILGFLTSSDLATLFLIADVKSVILIYNLPTFNDFENLTYFRNFWPRMTFVDLVTPFFWKADVKGVILIYNLPTFDDFWNLTLNDPKFVIWPQTKIFSSGNHNQVLLIILSYRSRKLVESVIFN